MNELLMKRVERIAEEEADGHVTIFRFGSGWKGAFGTLDVRGGTWSDELSACVLDVLPAFKTLDEFLEHLITTRPNFYYFCLKCLKPEIEFLDPGMRCRACGDRWPK